MRHSSVLAAVADGTLVRRVLGVNVEAADGPEEPSLQVKPRQLDRTLPPESR